MAEDSDELTFVPEQVEQIATDVIENVLKDKNYHDHMVQGWIDEICAKITLELIQLQKPFKYIVSCIVMQKNGAGLHSCNSCYWDSVNDNTVQLKWPNEKKKDATLQCIVSVWGVTH